MTKDNNCLVDGKRNHKNCFQWGHTVFCHDCKQYVASSYVARYFKFPYWLSNLEFDKFEERAIAE